MNISDAGNKQKRKKACVSESVRKYRTRQLHSDELKNSPTSGVSGQMCFSSERKDSVFKCNLELKDGMEGNEMRDGKDDGILSSNFDMMQYKVGFLKNCKSSHGDIQYVTFLEATSQKNNL